MDTARDILALTLIFKAQNKKRLKVNFDQKACSIILMVDDVIISWDNDFIKENIAAFKKLVAHLDSLIQDNETGGQNDYRKK